MLGRKVKEEIRGSQGVKVNRFFRDMLELEKG